MLKSGLKAAVVVAGMVGASTAFADGHSGGDAAAGEKVFKKCMACHQVGPDAKAKVGPPLTGVVGRKAGSVEGFEYGKSMAAAGEAGLVWTEEELFAFLKHPRNYLREKLDDKKAKTQMSRKLKKDEDRANIIAYLKTFQ